MDKQQQFAPHIRGRDSLRSVMSEVVIALCPLYFMAAYFYGIRPLFMGLVSVACAYLSDLLCNLWAGRKFNKRDMSAIVTGMLLPLMMSAATPYYVAAAAALFAILLVKQPFGGLGQNLFNPAAAGFAFVSVCWPTQVFTYPAPLNRLPAFGDAAVRTAESLTKVLRQGAVPNIDTLDLILGKFAGSMGVTNILVLASCLIFLLFRKAISWQTTLCYLWTVSLFAALFPRIPAGPADSILYELLSGTLVFAGIFLLNDPVTSPKMGLSRALYGILAGVVTMLFRRYGGYEQMAMFAVLFMNAIAPQLDRWGEGIMRMIRRNRFGFWAQNQKG